MVKPGAVFEGEIKASMKTKGYYNIKLYALIGNSLYRYSGKRPPFDYLCFFPVLNCAIECKSVKNTTFPLGNISDEQLEELIKFQASGVNRISFVLINYRLGKEYNLCIGLPIKSVLLLKNMGYKSLKLKDLDNALMPQYVLLERLKGSIWNIDKINSFTFSGSSTPQTH